MQKDEDVAYIKKYMKKEKWEEAFIRLERGEPVQYIVGNVEFYGNTIFVDKNVLIPRFETEELVYRTLKYNNQYLNKDVFIVDIGTGSGAIAIALKKELPNCCVDAVDISKKALEVAKKNATYNKVNIDFYEGNLLEPLNKKYDILISNPPYIDKDEEIMDIVKNYEPHIALYAAHQGLFCYEQILKDAHHILNKKNMIAFEIGYKQGAKIKKIAKQYFPKADIWVEKDLSNRDRFVFILNK